MSNCESNDRDFQDFLRKCSQISITQCQEIANFICRSNDENEVKEGFEKLLENQPLLNFNFYSGQTYWRGRKCDADGYQHINELSYPPSHKIKEHGSLNNLHIPILYTSSQKYTALMEIGAHQGCHIHLIGYRIKEDKPLRIGLIGELFHVYRTGLSMLNPCIGESLNDLMNNSLTYEVWRSIVFVDGFLASMLRIPRHEAKQKTICIVESLVIYCFLRLKK